MAKKDVPIATSIQIAQDIPWADVASLLCTGMEGDMASCWARVHKYVKPPKLEYTMDKLDNRPKEEQKVYRHIDYPLNEGGAVILWDFEDSDQENPKLLTLDREALIRGLKVMADKYPRHFSDFINDNSDAITGDVYIQCCVFGDVIYG